MKAKALLFGLNYSSDPSMALQGCINDVRNMAAYIQSEVKIPCEVITDDVSKKDTTCIGIMNKLSVLAMDTWRESLDFVWIHYSGHGSFVRDANAEEIDCNDECIVPTDARTAGLISDDIIHNIFRSMNPKTRVVAVFDCCHSGTIGDLKFSWESMKACVVENAKSDLSNRVITLSGCMDHETAADAYNVDGDKTFTGALTSCLLKVFKADKTNATRSNVFLVLDALRKKLVQMRFSQKPKLCSSYSLVRDMTFIPSK